MENLETRVILNEDSEIRMDVDSRNIFGDAIIFNRESKLIYEDGALFYEVIKPEAIQGVIEKSDIKVWLNHDKNRGLLARSKNGVGSLKLEAGSNSVKFSFEAPRFALGDELVENVKRGDLNGTSFAFSVAKGGEKWGKRADGTTLRTITKFERIGDISPCYDPAYADTTIALRSMQTCEIEEIKPVIEEPIIAPIIEAAPVAEIDVVEWYRKQRRLY